MKHHNFPVTDEIRLELAKHGIRRASKVKVRKESYDKFLASIRQGGYTTLSDEQKHALAISCCMTHPDHKDKHRRIPQYWYWVAVAIGLLLLLGLSARAQGTSQIDVITFQNSSAVNIKSFAAPFKIKCSTNITCTASGSTLTMAASGGAGGSGYSAIQNAGVAIAAEGAINFLGSFSCVDNPGNASSDCKLSASAAVSHQFITGIDASGNYLRAQPAYSDISGTPTLPATLANASHKWFNSYDSTTGLFTQTQPDYSDLTGVPSTFAPSAHNLLSASHGDTTAASAVRGDGLFAIGATPTWQRLAHSATTGGYFKWNGTDIVASTGAAAGTGTPTACSNQFVTSITNNADAAPTTVCASVARASEGADARGWAFCGTATAAATTVGPVSASTCCSGGLCQQYMVIYQIRGYNGGTPVGRLLVANGTISTTALTNSFSISEGVTAPTTGSGGTAIPGLPLAVTLSAIGRSGVVFIDGASGQIKSMNVIGNEGTPSVATAPTLFRGASFFSDLGTNLALANFQLSVYDTLAATAVSAQAFTTGTYLMVLGRKTD